jgi:hypothetical protein
MMHVMKYMQSPIQPPIPCTPNPYHGPTTPPNEHYATLYPVHGVSHRHFPQSSFDAAPPYPVTDLSPSTDASRITGLELGHSSVSERHNVKCIETYSVFRKE